MTDKERITEILKAYTKKHNIMASSVILEEYAEELLANGVIVPPCEIGADVWYLSGDVKNGWETLKPTHAEKVSGGFNLKMLNSITGKLEPWYFLSKEEAEKAL